MDSDEICTAPKDLQHKIQVAITEKQKYETEIDMRTLIPKN